MLQAKHRTALSCGREEEVSFSRTLVKGLELFKKAAAAAKGGQRRLPALGHVRLPARPHPGMLPRRGQSSCRNPSPTAFEHG